MISRSDGCAMSVLRPSFSGAAAAELARSRTELPAPPWLPVWLLSAGPRTADHPRTTHHATGPSLDLALVLHVPYGLLNACAERRVHVLPVLERANQHWLGDAFEQMPGGIGDQPVSGRIVEDLADQDASLSPVVVFCVQGAGSPDHVSVHVPQRFGGARRVGDRAALGVGCVYRVGGVHHSHRAVLGVGADGGDGCVDGDLLVVDPKPGAMRVGVRES